MEEIDSSIKMELSKMTFEELQKLKEKIGSKVYKEALYGTTTVKKQDFKRANKNRPREVSSKLPPHKVQPIVKKASTARDPRFDRLCGTYDELSFKKDYSFLSDIRKNEKEELKKQLEAAESPQEVEKIKYLLQRMENQDKEEERKKKIRERKRQEREDQIQNLKEGQKPHFRTKYEKKVVNLVHQYSDLKKGGKLQKHIEKHRKKSYAKVKRTRYFAENDSADVE